jgi:hypothetical protein
LAVAITVIAVSAITLLLVIGAAITPYSIVFAKKHSNGGNNNGNDQKQKDHSGNGSNTPQDQPTNSGDQSPTTDGNPPTQPPPVQNEIWKNVTGESDSVLCHMIEHPKYG